MAIKETLTVQPRRIALVSGRGLPLWCVEIVRLPVGMHYLRLEIKSKKINKSVSQTGFIFGIAHKLHKLSF